MTTLPVLPIADLRALPPNELDYRLALDALIREAAPIASLEAVSATAVADAGAAYDQTAQQALVDLSNELRTKVDALISAIANAPVVGGAP